MTDESRSGPAGALRRQGGPVGEELRSLAVAAVVEDGMSVSAAARRFGLSRDSVGSWVKRFRERGHVRRDPVGGSASRIEPHRERIIRIIEARPAISMYGLRDALAAEGFAFHAATVQNFLKRHGLERDRRLARFRRRRKRWTER
ncbi:MAG: helix-turn-helix domain-containing protein [Alphaproteobacteria bacterium]|nr:helix-turn-helix domain-containing protein [Alphaproteobacteria bacterium]